MTDVIGSVGLLVRPITTNFAAETQAKVKEALRDVHVETPKADFKNVEESAKKAKTGIITEFNQASKESQKNLANIGKDSSTFSSAQRNAEAAADKIRREFIEAARDATRELSKIDGGGTGDGGRGNSGGRGRGRDGGRGGSQIEELVKAGAGVAAGLSVLKIPIVLQGVSAAIGGISSLTAAVVALSGALSTLSGAAVSIPVVYSALGQAFGVAKLASGGISEALKAQSTQQAKAGATAKKAAEDEITAAAARRAAAERIIDATQAVTRAQNALLRAQETLTGAQAALSRSYKEAAEAIEDARFASADAIIGEERARLSIARTELAQRRLNDARRQAIEELEDLKLAIEGTALSEERARIRLEEALKAEAELRDRAAQTGTVSANELASANLAVREAELALREVIESRGDQQERLIEVQKAAAGQDEESALATQEAALAIREAQLGLLKAIDNRIDRQEILADMEAKGIDRSDIVVRAQEGVARAQEGVRDATIGVEGANRNLTLALQAAADAARKFGADGSGAVDEFKEAMEGLSPAARSFVNKIGEIKDRFKDLRDVASENLFPGVVAGLDAITPLFDDLEPVIAATARVLGGLARRAGELVGSPAFKSDIVRLGRGNLAIISDIGESALSLVSAFKDIMVVGQPLVRLMSTLGRSFAKDFADTVAASRESGNLAEFFERTKGVLLDVISIVGDMFGIIRGLFSAGFPEGAKYLFDLRVVFENLRALVAGAAADGSLADWFESARPSVEAIAGAISDLVSGLFKIGAEIGPQLAPVFEKIRNDLVPAILSLVENIDAEFLEVLVGLVSEAVKFLDTFLQASEVLTAVLLFFQGALKLANFLGRELGIVSDILVNILSALTLMGTFAAAFKLARIISEFAFLRRGIELVTEAHGKLGTKLSIGFGVASTVAIVGLTLVYDKYREAVDKARTAVSEIESEIETNNIDSYRLALEAASGKANEASGVLERYSGTLGGLRAGFHNLTDILGLSNHKVAENVELAKKIDGAYAGWSVAYSNLVDNIGDPATGSIGLLTKEFGLTREEAVKLANVNKIDLSESFDKVKVPIGEALEKTRDSVLAARDLSGEHAVLASAASTTTEKFDAFNTALDKTLGLSLSLFDAETAEQRALNTLQEAYEKAAGKASLHTEEGLRLRDALKGATERIIDKANAALLDAGGSVEAKARAAEYIEELEVLKRKYPGVQDQIQKFIDKIKAAADTPPPVIRPKWDDAEFRRQLDEWNAYVKRQIGQTALSDTGGARVRLAHGGIFNRATAAIIGEAGPEVVIPLTNAKRALELTMDSGLLEVLAKAQHTGAPAKGPGAAPLSGGGSGPGVVFGPGSVVVQFSGSVTPDEARMVGQQLGRGIEDVMAAQEAQVEAGAY